MTIDAIRKRYAANADADNPTYYCTLSSADVDALFAALDSLQNEYDQYKELVGESLMKEVERLGKALDDALDGLTAWGMK